MKIATLFLSMMTSVLMINTIWSAQHFYAGGGVGYQTLHGKIVSSSSSVTNMSISGDGGIVSLFAGYAVDLDEQFQLAGEINAEPSTVSVSVEAFGENSAKTYGGVGFSIRPFYIFSEDAKLFAVIGYQASKFVGTVAGTEIASQWVDGVRFGGGVELNINENLGIRGEALQTRYRKYKEVIQPVTNQITVGLVWHFK